MASIKRRGVAAGGVVAGMMLIASGAILARLVDLPGLVAGIEGHTPDLVTPLLVRIGVGFALVWVYVGFRPRFGAGSRAVAGATGVVWVAHSAALASVAALFPILSPLTVALIVVWSLIELTMACVAGAAVYRRHVAATTRKRGRGVAHS